MDQLQPVSTPPTGPEGTDWTGQTFGDFHVLRRLGQGGMGQVYLAEQISLKRKVALKILRPELSADPQALVRFRNEAEAVARATHANIVQVHAFGEARGLSYMALEFVEGKNLKEYLEKKGTLDPLPTLGILRQVASALQRAGELGIIHRDIKPENILLTRKGEVKVADFGLSRCLVGEQPARLTQSGVVMGTPLYMSPEQVEGAAIDCRSDIYSLGVTAYHVLAGQPPFRGASAIEVALQHLRAEPTPLASIRPDLPRPLCALVHKMMAKDPAQRYQTGHELLQDILRVRGELAGSTGTLATNDLIVEGVPLSAPAPVRFLSLLRRTPVLVGISLVLALAAGLALGRGYRQKSDLAQEKGAGSGEFGDWQEHHALPRREQALREAAEQYLNPATGSRNVGVGFGLCLDLGLFYLEHERLEEADRLFSRLATPERPRPCRSLGRLGRAIVLALRSQPLESNRILRELCDSPEMGETPPRGQGGRKPEADVLMWNHPRLRFWVAQALDYNVRNGLPEKEIPAPLAKLRALTTGR